MYVEGARRFLFGLRNLELKKRGISRLDRRYLRVVTKMLRVDCYSRNSEETSASSYYCDPQTACMMTNRKAVEQPNFSNPAIVTSGPSCRQGGGRTTSP